VKRGSIEQYVKMLHAAAYGDVCGLLQVLPASEYRAAFTKAKEGNFAQQIVLQY
jgi:hypothetical protein